MSETPTTQPPQPEDNCLQTLGSTRKGPLVVLVRTQFQGNVGSTARAMANNGMSRLVLVDPANPIDSEARALAVGAGHILDASRTVSTLEEALGESRFVVGTTASRDRQLLVPVQSPRRLAEEFATRPPEDVAFVFGQEASGLTNEELAICHRLVCIPASPKQPTLNVSQAVLLVCHEYYLATLEHPAPQKDIGDGAHQIASMAEVEGLFEHLGEVTQQIGFARDTTIDSVLLDLRRLAARSELTAREVQLIRGLFRRTLNTIARRK